MHKACAALFMFLSSHAAIRRFNHIAGSWSISGGRAIRFNPVLVFFSKENIFSTLFPPNYLFTMQKRHSNGQLYFDELAYSTEKYIIPYIHKHYPISGGMSVLEIGCGAGGNLQPFLALGCSVTGFDLSSSRIEEARQILDAENSENVRLFCCDVFEASGLGKFDVILVRDVIEHIPDKHRFFRLIKDFLREDGIIYFAFPAWYMPFGGHQQICRSKFLSRCPFFHILPKFIYRLILALFGESKGAISELMSVNDCRITVEQFRRYAKSNGYAIFQETLYFINPHYEVKFHLKPRKLHPLVAKLPFIRNFFTTGCFYLLKQKQ
jgi:SAM-dependent methyltransferase